MADTKTYEKRRLKFNKLLEMQTKHSNIISNLRLLVFFLGIGAAVYIYIKGQYYFFVSVLTATAILFFYLVYIHEKLLVKRRYSSIMCEINDKSIKRLKGEWKSFKDSGEESEDESHNYSIDLDIFGGGSLFQWLNVTATFSGRQRLKDVLTKRDEDVQRIFDRQEAVLELDSKIAWRQRFYGEGLNIEGSGNNPEQLLKWAQEPWDFILKPYVVLFFRVLPLITISFCVLSFGFKMLPYFIPVLFLVLQYGLLRLKNYKRTHRFMEAEKYNADIKAYKRMLERIERHKFHSKLLADNREKLFNNSSTSASRQVNKLSKTVDSIDNLRNAIYAVINLLFLLEYQYIIKLERWKKESGSHLRDWLQVIGEFECLSSLAQIKYDNPLWVMPSIDSDRQRLSARNMGHPLINKEKRVCSNLSIIGSGTTLLITGSNMSGKSTLLRTSGINLVLAYAGAPVCADSFTCSLMDIYTCMRIKDNLEENISSFYAELIKIKKIVSAAKSGRKIFFLLDEIFKGTNSSDRHTGAATLIKQLGRYNAIGLVSTHDLELGNLEGNKDFKVNNYHFEEYYRDNEIYFDYKLRRGVSATRNAIYLMRLAGIEVEDA